MDLVALLREPEGVGPGRPAHVEHDAGGARKVPRDELLRPRPLEGEVRLLEPALLAAQGVVAQDLVGRVRVAQRVYFSVQREEPLVAGPQQLRLADAVGLAGQDQEVGGHADRQERVVELPALRDGHPLVLVAVDDEARGLHVAGVEESRAVHVHLRVLPRPGAEVGAREVRDVGGAGERGEVRDRGAHDRRLEPVGLRHDRRGHEAAVGPAVDREPIGVGDAPLDERVDALHEVLVVLDAPVAHVGGAELLAVAAAAARVREEDRVALLREERPAPQARRRGEGVRVRPGRAHRGR